MLFRSDCAIEAAKNELSNVFVTNGYMSEESAALAGHFLDAANVDLKGATEEHYLKVCGAGLQPVLDTIRALYMAGVWIEVTTLVIPGYNDDRASLEFMADFIASVDLSIPWHLSKFFPTYKLQDAPPTPLETLEKAGQIGEEAGLKYVYLGNVPGKGDETKCFNCKTVLIRRAGFGVKELNLTEDGNCKSCGEAFEGVFKSRSQDSGHSK